MVAKKNNNHKQDIDIVRLEEKFKGMKLVFEERFKTFGERFDTFIANDFEHLRGRVDWLIGLIIVSILIPIFIKLLF